MPTTFTTTAATLYAAILLQPEDDTLRLAFADALGDGGDHARAEFVRVQVELASLGSPVPNTARVCELAHREHELLAAHGDGWRWGEVCPECKGIFTRTLVEADGTGRRIWLDCPKCRGTGYTSPLMRERRPWVPGDSEPPSNAGQVRDYQPQFSRGLIAQYSARHDEVFDRDGPNEWACEVARAFPIQEIRLTTHPAWEAGGSWGIGGNPHQNSPPLLHFIHWEVRQLAIRDGVVKANDDLRFPARELAEHYQALAVALVVRAKAFEEQR